MSIKQFLERILQNWPVKIICFVLGIMIYFFHQLSSLERKTFTVPLEIKDNGMMVPGGSWDKYRYVRITVRGMRDQLASVSENDFRTYLDISYQTHEGEFVFPVIVQPSERIMLMEPLEIRTNPESVPLAVEKRAVKFVGIRPSISGSPAYGYEQAGSSVTPSTVRIEGPRSLVEGTSFVYTDEVSVQNASTSLESRVGILDSNKLITFDSVDSVRVTVVIRPEGSSKEFALIPVALRNLRSGLEIQGEAPVVTLAVTGDLLVLDSLTPEMLSVTADCGGITEPGEYSVSVRVSVPLNVTLVSQSVDTVPVTVTRKSRAHEPSGASEPVLPETEEGFQGFVPGAEEPVSGLWQA